MVHSSYVYALKQTAGFFPFYNKRYSGFVDFTHNLSAFLYACAATDSAQAMQQCKDNIMYIAVLR